MSVENLRDEVLTVLEGKFGLSRAQITDESLLNEDLNLDSIDLFDIMGDIEQKIGVRVEIAEFIKARTFGDFVSTLDSLIAKAQAA
jgi:acyl carrier protein